jgi:hypothetical protein
LGSVWARFGLGSGSVWAGFGLGLGLVRARFRFSLDLGSGQAQVGLYTAGSGFFAGLGVYVVKSGSGLGSYVPSKIGLRLGA